MKWLLGIIVVIGIAGALWWFGLFNAFFPGGENVPTATTIPEQVTPLPPNDLPTALNDASDVALMLDASASLSRLEDLRADIEKIEEYLAYTSLQTAAQEKERRTTALNALAGRVGEMNKVTPEFKQNLQSNITAQINSTGVATTSAALTESFGIFSLIMPQTYIAAAADRQATLINMLASVGTKLQARAEALQGSGADLAPIATALQTMGTQLQSAQAHAQAAVTGSATLIPSQDATSGTANEIALTTAQTEIEAAETDLAGAAGSMTTILTALQISASGTTTQPQ